MRVAIAFLAVASLAGCGSGTYAEQEKEMKALVAAHFDDLNAGAAASVQQAKATRTDVDIAVTALVLNRYEWSLEGAVYPDVTCPPGGCGAKLGTLATTGVELRCPECGTALGEELTRIGRARPMYEIKSASGQTPVVALVRYIRRSYAYDPNSAVMVSSKANAQYPIDSIAGADRRGQGAYYAGGFYRITGAAIATTVFVYKGGGIVEADPASVKKMIADPPENVPVSAMKLGSWGGVEEPLKPWLGKPPVGGEAKAAPADAPKDAPKDEPKPN